VPVPDDQRIVQEPRKPI